MGEAIERVLISNDWITIVLLIVILLLVFNKIRYVERFQNLQSLLYSNTYISNYSKVSPLVFNTFNIVFVFIIILIISLLVFCTAHLYHFIPNTGGKNLFFLIVSYTSIFIVSRFLLGFILAYVFEKEKEHQYYTFIKISYLGNFCLLMLPLLILNFYIDSILFTRILLVITPLFILFYFVLQIKNNQKLVFSKMFYFILYLCALEISPFIIIYKLIIK